MIRQGVPSDIVYGIPSEAPSRILPEVSFENFSGTSRKFFWDSSRILQVLHPRFTQQFLLEFFRSFFFYFLNVFLENLKISAISPGIPSGIPPVVASRIDFGFPFENPLETPSKIPSENYFRNSLQDTSRYSHSSVISSGYFQNLPGIPQELVSVLL